MLKIILLMTIIAIVLAFAESAREQKHFKVVRYQIQSQKLKGLKAPLRFVVLADLHNKSYGVNNERLLDAIREAQPDGILIAGDMIVARPGADMTVATGLIRELAAEYPIYYGNGNHEYRLKLYPEDYGTMYDEFMQVLRENQVIHLENEQYDLPGVDLPVRIYGLDLERQYYQRFQKTKMDRSYLDDVLGPLDGQAYNILLAHNPAYFTEYSRWGADLVLSGHLHGGIVRIPGIGGLISPQVDVFPRYSGGIYEKDGSTMVLSRGLGTHTINFRLFNRPELIVLAIDGK